MLYLCLLFTSKNDVNNLNATFSQKQKVAVEAQVMK